MDIIPADKEQNAAIGGGEPQTLWQKIAQALDRFASQRSHRIVPAMALRRSKYDHDRCRRLMQTLRSQS